MGFVAGPSYWAGSSVVCSANEIGNLTCRLGFFMRGDAHRKANHGTACKSSRGPFPPDRVQGTVERGLQKGGVGKNVKTTYSVISVQVGS